MSTWLSTSEAVSIDLVAMRNWHFHCSLDKARSPEMRRWHRRQVGYINERIPKRGPGSLALVKIVLIECLASQARKGLHVATNAGAPFDWRKFCEAVSQEIDQVKESQD